MSLLWVNGEFKEAERARIDAADRGLLYADGAFTTLRVAGNSPKLVDLHLERLFATLDFLAIPRSHADFPAIVTELSLQNALPDAAARITITRGSQPGTPRPASGGEPTVIITLRPLPPTLAKAKMDGVAARSLPFPSRAVGLPLQGHKTLAYLTSVVAWQASGEGVEPILETTCGNLSEGAASNLFWCKNGELFTPSLEAGCLPGVARRALLTLARKAGWKVNEGLYPKAALAASDEAFFVNAVAGVIPIAAFDGVAFGGKPGPLTRRASELLEKEALNLDNARGAF